jgi:hypothetical protein
MKLCCEVLEVSVKQNFNGYSFMAKLQSYELWLASDLVKCLVFSNLWTFSDTLCSELLM